VPVRETFSLQENGQANVAPPDEVPIYGMAQVARYVGVPYQTLRYWTRGSGRVPPLVHLASDDPPALSFVNLLECHVLSAMRGMYDLRIPRVRRALATVGELFPSPHPLVMLPFETDGVDLFIRQLPDAMVNVSRHGQLAMKEMLEAHLRRIERDSNGLLTFFPFVEERSPAEPKVIMMSPAIAFGKPVIAGTGISTSVIASRFHARESIADLAREYGRPESEIEEAVRWESRSLAA
jgi:uncharacterized protein (DUF433 family)